MIKHLSQLKHKIGEREFSLLCESDSPLNEVKEALFEFLKYLGKIEDSVKQSQQLQKEEVKDEGKEQIETESVEAS